MKLKRNFKQSSMETKSGFTIVEVTLVTAFVALLAIAIITVLTGMLSIFQKGMTLRSVDSVGRELISEFTTAINSAPSVDSNSLCHQFLTGGESVVNQCLKDKAYRFIYQDKSELATDPMTGEQTAVQQYGLFCTGEYTYAWNTWYGKDSGNTLDVKFIAGSQANFKLIRFTDKEHLACARRINKMDYSISDATFIDMETTVSGAPNTNVAIQTNFLEDSETNLDLYEMIIFPFAQDTMTLRGFFSGTFILGTDKGDASIIRSGDYCEPNSSAGETGGNTLDMGSMFNYCGINKFNFAARTAGKGV